MGNLTFDSADPPPDYNLLACASNPTSSRRMLKIVGDGSPGGATTVVLDLSRKLAERRIPIVLASHHGSYIIAEATRLGIETLELNFSARSRTGQNALALMHYLRHAGRQTIVHAHGARAALPAALVPRRLHAGMIYTIHGHHYRQKEGIFRDLAWRAERFCIRRSGAVVFVSRGDEQIAKEDHLLRPRDPYEVIYNGCPISEPDEATPRFDVAYLGRLVPDKNTIILPDILLAMRPARPTLCIIGGGEVEAALRDRVERAGLSDQVTFLGILPHRDALRRLAQARVMIFPSRWEGLPVSIIEAMHRGIPVVCSDIPGNNELITDGATGYLVQFDDVNAFANRLRRLITDESLRRSMGAHARQKARDEFSLDRQVRSHLSLYRRMIGADMVEV